MCSRSRFEVLLMWWVLFGSDQLGPGCLVLRVNPRENPRGKNRVMTTPTIFPCISIPIPIPVPSPTLLVLLYTIYVLHFFLVSKRSWTRLMGINLKFSSWRSTWSWSNEPRVAPKVFKKIGNSYDMPTPFISGSERAILLNKSKVMGATLSMYDKAKN